MKIRGNRQNSRFIQRAKEVLKIESQAVAEQIRHVDRTFAQVVQTLHEIVQRGGQVMVMGIGKSGLVGRKIASTLSSTGAPANFIHPSEGLHGDLGMVRNGDGVLVLSYSGETEEIRKMLPLLKEKKVTLIAFTSRKNSRLGRTADYVICSSVRKEACPMNLTPTASTTAVLALGDALAMALMEKKGFQPSDFAKLHPGGTLGKKLNLTVRDFMHRGRKNAIVRVQSTVRQGLLEMTRTRLGATNVIDEQGKLLGFFTDGDLRRRLQKDAHLLGRSMKEVMTKNPKTITPGQTLNEGLKMFTTYGFDNLPVVDEKGKSVGILDERDLLAEGIA